MPWKETSIMDQRIRFIRDYQSGDYTKKALCMHYGISRPTGDKWIQRYRMYGLEGLHERSRDPTGTPHRISLRLPARLLRLPLKGGVIAEKTSEAVGQTDKQGK